MATQEEHEKAHLTQSRIVAAAYRAQLNAMPGRPVGEVVNLTEFIDMDALTPVLEVMGECAPDMEAFTITLTRQDDGTLLMVTPTGEMLATSEELHDELDQIEFQMAMQALMSGMLAGQD